MIILIDSKEQRNMHITQVLSNKGIKFKVVNLDFCDYTFEFQNKDYRDLCAVERKASLTELSGNVAQGHKRFDNEFRRGMNNNCKMTLLIEDIMGREKMIYRRAKDSNPLLTNDEKKEGTWKSGVIANSIIGTLKAFKERYNLDLVFCRKIESAEKIIEIFEKFLQEEKQNEINKNDI